MMMLVTLIYVICHSVWYAQITIRYGRVSLIFLTFLFAWIIDQIKSFLSLSLIYLVVNRRFGFLKENEKEWLDVALYNEVDEDLLALIDSVFLTFFFIEILLKSFASSGMFLADFFNGFDAAIVIASEVFNIMQITAKGLGVLRLIRVVVITIRKITGN